MNDVTIVKYSYTILTVCYALRLHVVEMKALFGSLFPLCTRLTVVCIRIDGLHQHYHERPHQVDGS